MLVFAEAKRYHCSLSSLRQSQDEPVSDEHPRLAPLKSAIQEFRAGDVRGCVRFGKMPKTNSDLLLG